MTPCPMPGLRAAVQRTVVLLAGFAVAAGVAHAQPVARIAEAYPVKPVKIVVGAAPGGGNDVIARLAAQKLTERSGEQFLVDNRVGANGVLAMNAAAQAAPDGYTLFSAGNLMVLNGVQKKVNYDIRTVFDPVAQMTVQPYLMLVSPGLPVKTVREFIDHVKARPDQLSYASSGVGSVNHLGTELLKLRAGLQMVHIPYKGNPPAFADMLSGRVHLIFASGISSASLVKAGKLKALAVASAERTPAAPDLPLLAETVSGFELGNAYFLYSHASTPRPVLAGLNKAVMDIMNSAEVKSKLAADGAEPGRMSSLAELKAKFIGEYAMWQGFLEKSGIRLDE